MIEVQRELNQLKQDAHERELKLQQEEKMLTPEEKMLWFREETMKLREKITEQESLLVDVKLENQELEDDSKFLKIQMKECKANK